MKETDIEITEPASSAWEIEIGEGPIIAAAIHDGHTIRPDISNLMAIDASQRLREEDPFTGNMTRVVQTRVLGTKSRFEIDLNRPIDLAVYHSPDIAWGLNVYKSQPTVSQMRDTLAIHTAFYKDVYNLIEKTLSKYGRAIVLDIHSYNHRRSGPEAAPADPSENPEVNVGTGTLLAREKWAPVIDQFILDLHSFDYAGKHLDVRENIKFRGGHFPQRLHERFPENVLVLSIEFKKFFMDEWTGQGDGRHLELIESALESTIPNLSRALSV